MAAIEVSAASSNGCSKITHVLHMDGRAWLAAGNNAIDKGVRASRHVGGRGTRYSSTVTATEASTATITASSIPSAASAVASTISCSTAVGAIEAAAEASTRTAEASTATKSTTTTKTSAAESAGLCVAVLANFKDASLPIVAGEVLDGVLGVFWSLECNDTRTLGCAVWSGMDICAHDVAYKQSQ